MSDLQEQLIRIQIAAIQHDFRTGHLEQRLKAKSTHFLRAHGKTYELVIKKCG